MRRSAAVQTQGVSLFPFLAVLVCTMGALIVLLVAMTRQSRLRAAEAATAEAAAKTVAPEPPSDDAALDREALDWRISQLQQAHDATGAQLTEEREKLSSMEQYLHHLKNRWKQLQERATALADASSIDLSRRQEADAELARLREEIRRAKLAYEEASRQARFQPASYAIIPYVGPNGTHRRPIYIECLPDRLVLQPEGVEFRRSDFEGSLGPANPLACAMRAAREYLVSRGPATGDPGAEPYPLFIVRPRGIGAYNIGREAMTSWGSEFGYEFVDEDWKLKFPPPDLELAEVEARAADEARRRTKHETSFIAQRLARGSRPVYRASPVRGGVVRVDKPGRADEDDFWDSSREERTGAADSRSRTDFTAETSRTGAPGEAPSGSAETSPAPQPKRSASRSLAATRGRNWGLQDAKSDLVRITRPIHIQCRADQLIILPEKGSQGGRSIVLGPRTEDAVDELVSAVSDCTDSWGIAGPNMKWRPMLVLEIGPGGEGRFADLQTLLADSGLEIKLKE